MNWHRIRKRVHLACFLIFLALPFLNIVRFDIPRQRFYFAGQELWISEFGIVFFSLMFLMFLVVVSSVFYGRVYCGYLCPQMIFSEASLALESRLRRLITRHFIAWKPAARAWAVRILFYGAVGIASVFLAFIFISYFVEPRDLLHRLLSFDIRTAGGISGAVVTLITFFDFTLLRQRFCTTACPYGYLQGMLSDGKTLLVHYRDPQKECIECKKCVRVCPMGIDIRNSPFQIECIHCAECIDACAEILARLKKPGLIHYTWGEKGPLTAQQPQPWDGKRIIVLLVLAFYACGLMVAMATRRPVLARIQPERATLYHLGSDGRVYNTFRYTLANRSSKPATVGFSVRALPGAMLSLDSEVVIGAGESRSGQFEISVPAGGRREMVTHFAIVTTASGQSAEASPMTFIAPTEKK
ncbi:MAG TPA: 4Fe-4S dicluster domain-containing protein [Bryobacteraceae bacterium]|nr:4Fe-4S dicluster domain-containing protein [Bryobacteraceae bacterium]